MVRQLSLRTCNTSFQVFLAFEVSFEKICYYSGGLALICALTFPLKFGTLSFFLYFQWFKFNIMRRLPFLFLSTWCLKCPLHLDWHSSLIWKKFMLSFCWKRFLYLWNKKDCLSFMPTILTFWPFVVPYIPWKSHLYLLTIFLLVELLRFPLHVFEFWCSVLSFICCVREAFQWAPCLSVLFIASIFIWFSSVFLSL